MGRPRVLMVTGAYYPEVTGAALQCRALIRALRGRVSCTVLSISSPSNLPARGTVDGVVVSRIFVNVKRVWSKASAILRVTWAFVRLQRRCDIVHLHGFSQKSLLLILLVKLFRKKLVLKLTSVGHDDPASIRRRGNFAFRCYAQADRFVGVSPRLEALYQASGLPQEKFQLIPNGVDLERFRPRRVEEQRALREALGLPHDVVWILFVGFFSHEKRPDVLFEAWTRLQGDGVSATGLLFIGATDGPYGEIDPRLFREIQGRATRLGLAQRVVSVEVTHEIERYYGAADCFVLPSLREGLPNVLLEAMASGLPCIATRLPGVTDTVIEDGVNGLLVPPGDWAALERALRLLVQEPPRAQALGQRARQTIEERYAMRDTAAQYLQLYQRVVERPCVG